MPVGKSKLPVIAAVVTAMMAVAASSASAQTLEITNEDTGLHCPAVSVTGTDVNGGCLGHAASESVEIRKHVFGIESHITTCNLEFHGRVNEDGGGQATEQAFSGASCQRQACKVGAEAQPWPVQGVEVLGTGEILTATFCIEPLGGGSDETCEIDLPLSQAPPDHTVELGAATELSAHGVSGFRCELVGHWVSETGGTHDGDPEGDLVLAHLN